MARGLLDATRRVHSSAGRPEPRHRGSWSKLDSGTLSSIAVAVLTLWMAMINPEYVVVHCLCTIVRLPLFDFSCQTKPASWERPVAARDRLIHLHMLTAYRQ
ncbi:hypothetical protein CRV24_000198 [Beauveria bassiana]|nr:hypothetical protein CRV24_000198 [Beauveria bassiana]